MPTEIRIPSDPELVVGKEPDGMTVSERISNEV